MPAADTIAVLDLEWTAWEGSRERRWQGPGEEMEIVHIGALRLRDDAVLSELETLEVLVKPRINPVLSDYLRDLTGLTQERVDGEGIGYGDALAALARFIGADTKAVYSYGTDDKVIEHNCVLNGVAFPFPADLFVNARLLLADVLGPEMMACDSSDLPKILDFAPPGTSHHPVEDCRCVAEALRIARERGRF